MQPFTYLLINFFTVIICFIFSFDKRIRFHQQFGAFLKSAIIVGIPFILWDIWFTNHGVWWFNYDYTIGFSIFGLPIEEWLFFLCIPFSCVFTYYCLRRFFDISWANAFNNMIVFLALIVCITVALLYYQRLYTFITVMVTCFSLIYFHFIAKKEWIGEASFVFCLLMLGFFPVNGILTGTGLAAPIVNYNSSEILNVRLFTIPVEDVVYGYTQFMWLVYFFKRFENPHNEFRSLKQDSKF